MMYNEDYYYCGGCRKFHKDDGNHKPVSRKLCFFCERIQPKKTKIIGDGNVGKSQICEACYKEEFSKPEKPKFSFLASRDFFKHLH